MQITNDSVQKFLETIPIERRKDIQVLIDIAKRLTNKEPKLWGSIIGFGSLHYRYKSGHEGDMPIIGFANRKQAITLYLSYQIQQYKELENLGKYKATVGCLYIKRLADINLDVLEVLMRKGIEETWAYNFITNNESEE